MKKSLIVGASSGIGRALARVFAQHDYQVGVVARRVALLEELRDEIGPAVLVKPADVANPAEAVDRFEELICQMGHADVVVVNAGVMSINEAFDWPPDEEMIRVNVLGFTALADAAMRHFMEQQRGHLVGISSVAAVRGHRMHPVYNATKAFVSTYMEGVRHKVAHDKLPISATDIRPGFVDTAMYHGKQSSWVASPALAAEQIFRAISKRKKIAYVKKRWRRRACSMRLTPDFIYHRY